MAKHRLTAFLDTTRRTKLNKVQSGLQKSRGKAEASLPTVITRNRYFIVLWAYVERIYERYETPGPEQIIKGTTDELDYNGIIAATKTAALQNGVNITRAAFTIPSWLNSPHPLSIAAYNQSVHPTLDSPRRKIAAATAASIQSSDRILILEIDYWFLEMGTLMLDSNFKRLVCSFHVFLKSNCLQSGSRDVKVERLFTGWRHLSTTHINGTRICAESRGQASDRKGNR